jgi:hypothetical protein
MSNQCLICLNNTILKQSDTCSVRCHNIYWNKLSFFSENNEYHPYNEYPHCQFNINGSSVVEDGIDIEKNNRITENIIVEFVNKVHLVIGYENKKNILMDMFEYIYNNISFFEYKPEFAIVVKKKLIEFNNTDNSNNWKKIYKNIFGQIIPLEYN